MGPQSDTARPCPQACDGSLSSLGTLGGPVFRGGSTVQWVERAGWLGLALPVS